jgi:hypothetical protein
MCERRYLSAILVIATLLLAAPMARAFPGCDNFGQDWQITLAAFGASFPGTSVVSGCRDCNASLGCGGQLPLDGTLSAVGAGHLIWSVTAYNPVGGACFSTHWSGLQQAHVGSVNGTVSNDAGPFGPMTMTLNQNCGSDSRRGPVDPTKDSGDVGSWAQQK